MHIGPERFSRHLKLKSFFRDRDLSIKMLIIQIVELIKLSKFIRYKRQIMELKLNSLVQYMFQVRDEGN